MRNNSYYILIKKAEFSTADQVKTYALQAWKPATYTSPDDADQLRTIFIGYVPSSDVTALEQAIRAKTSALYTGVSGISAQLSAMIDASYSVTSVSDPITGSGGSANSTGGSSNSNHTRLDAIIGVCSALGGIALCILGFLLYRNFRRKQEAAHHRLADANNFDGTPPAGQDFDRDSVGGQRRRSFYYAEDSLRGYSHPPEDGYEQRVTTQGAGGMRERRAVVPGVISAPILRDNTLNW